LIKEENKKLEDDEDEVGSMITFSKVQPARIYNNNYFSN
jgi:hypothetical protein